MDVTAAPPPLWTARTSLVRQQQLQTDWCWAATTSAIATTYDDATKWNQGAVADSIIVVTPPEKACSIDGSSDECNQPMRLDRSLRAASILGNGSPMAPIAFAAIQTEIDNGRPFGARIAWAGGGAHFVAVSGFDATNERLLIEDPLWGTADYSFADFSTAYRGPGNAWTHAYLTIPGPQYAPPGGGGGPIIKKYAAPPPPAVANRPTHEHFNWAISRYVNESETGSANTIDVYFLGLQDAKDNAADPFVKAQLIGSRAFYDTGRDVISVEIDFDEKRQRDPHMTAGQRATSLAVAAARQTFPSAQVRLLKMPGISFQALWIVKGDGDALRPLAPAPAALQNSADQFDAATIAPILASLAGRQLELQAML